MKILWADSLIPENNYGTARVCEKIVCIMQEIHRLVNETLTLLK